MIQVISTPRFPIEELTHENEPIHLKKKSTIIENKNHNILTLKLAVMYFSSTPLPHHISGREPATD